MYQKYHGDTTWGTDAEFKFRKIAKQHGFFTEKASSYEDKVEHIDWWIRAGKIKYSVEVKALKHISRKDESLQDKMIWIETQNINGDKGWIDGKEDLIAFEMEDAWVLVNRAALRDYVYKVVDFTAPLVTRPQDAYHRLYKRRDEFERPVLDRVTLLTKAEVLKFTVMSWPISTQ